MISTSFISMKPLIVFFASLVILLVQPNDWEPVVEVFNGVPMVLVPAGCFEMGYEAGTVLEQPVHTYCIEADYWIDQFEVSNEQFERLNGMAETASPYPDPTLPRVHVMWSEAYNFCQARGGRLPTESEWEYAARGLRGHLFAGGDEPRPSDINACDASCEQPFRDKAFSDGYAEVSPIGAFEVTTWVGAYDMNGNVWEWVDTAFDVDLYAYPFQADDRVGNPEKVFEKSVWLEWLYPNKPNNQTEYGKCLTRNGDMRVI